MIEISGGRIKRHDKRIWFLLLGVFAAVFLFTFLTGYHKSIDSDVEAASLAEFDPGFIISDWQMSNSNSMTEAEIQSFLSSKGNCRDTNIGKANNYPHLSYHIVDGHFVCLAEERFGDGETIGQGDTAAHIIWQAAQDYRINPQVLIVLLQKEQGLITDSWPNNVQYRSATGYGCPDTAACSSKYYGFKNQIRNAAGMFRTVLNGGWTNYPLGNNYVQYNPNADCGGSIVNIRSLATSALYRYTPYQPNAGALAAGYGTAYCGEYGNRNFYLYFQDWFGGITFEGNTDEKSINDAYNANGGERVFGKAKTGILENPQSGIKWVEYEKGYIVGNQSHGFYVSMGPIRDVWVKYSWELGVLGFPKTNILSNPSSGIEWQEFENGFIVGNAAHGYHISMGAIRDVWVKQRWELGVLGFPSSDILKETNGIEYQEYENNMIVFGTPSYGYRYTYKELYNVWKEHGFDDSGLGKPVSDLSSNPSSGIEWLEFQNGYIVGNRKRGFYLSMGPIRDVWVRQSWELGPLGFPTSDIITESNGVKYQEYEHDLVVVGSDNYGYYYVPKGIYNVWKEHGYDSIGLGKPKTNVLSNPASKIEWQEFENGYIVGNSVHGYYLSMGPIRDVWVRQGWEFGSLGFPKSDIIKDADGTIHQEYDGGTVYYSQSSGSWIR